MTDQYIDDREDYVQNEVTIDYNAAYQSSIAELCRLYCSGADAIVKSTHIFFVVLLGIVMNKQLLSVQVDLLA